MPLDLERQLWVDCLHFLHTLTRNGPEYLGGRRRRIRRRRRRVCTTCVSSGRMCGTHSMRHTAHSTQHTAHITHHTPHGVGSHRVEILFSLFSLLLFSSTYRGLLGDGRVRDGKVEEQTLVVHKRPARHRVKPLHAIVRLCGVGGDAAVLEDIEGVVRYIYGCIYMYTGCT